MKDEGSGNKRGDARPIMMSRKHSGAPSNESSLSTAVAQATKDELKIDDDSEDGWFLHKPKLYYGYGYYFTTKHHSIYNLNLLQ